MENEEISQPRMSVDLNAVKHNYEELRKKANGAEVCPVVKSNAYGLGGVGNGQSFTGMRLQKFLCFDGKRRRRRA